MSRKLIATFFISLDGVVAMGSSDAMLCGRAAVAALKQQPGKDIVMSGSATLARSLLRDGLVDELHLMIHPVVVAEGGRLFEDGEKHALELIDSKTFGTGVAHATYRPAASPGGS